MKLSTTLSLIVALSVSSLAYAQSSGTKDMDMKGMKDMDKKHPTKEAKAMTHKVDAVVKDVDAASGKVTLAHEPVKSLGWPAMTMGFAVKDKMLLDKLVVDKKVHVELQKQGNDYVITAVK